MRSLKPRRLPKPSSNHVRINAAIFQNCCNYNLHPWSSLGDVILNTIICDVIGDSPSSTPGTASRISEISELAADGTNPELDMVLSNEQELLRMTEPEMDDPPSETSVEAFGQSGNGMRRPAQRNTKPTYPPRPTGTKPKGQKFRVPDSMRDRCLLCSSSSHSRYKSCPNYQDKVLGNRCYLCQGYEMLNY